MIDCLFRTIKCSLFASLTAICYQGRRYRSVFTRCVGRHLIVFNALIPIPRRVLRKGFGEAGQKWMWANWGVRWLIRRVTLAIERHRKGGVEPVAVFRFLSEDWSPWIALLRIRERWPELRFEMKPEYLEISGIG